ncbi:MAG: response regulator [Chloroflexota bacterium]
MTRVIIADDHAVVRHGLRQILAGTSDMTLAGEAQSGQQVLQLLEKDDFDVLVLDISMPGPSGLDILRHLKETRPSLRVLVLSIHPEDQYAVRVLRAGADGYLTKETAPDELIAAIRKVSRGGKYISSSLAERLALELETQREGAAHQALSNREFEVLRRIASGKTIGDIAHEMGLSIKTISTYRSRILEKLGLRNNLELVRYALWHGLAD